MIRQQKTNLKYPERTDWISLILPTLGTNGKLSCRRYWTYGFFGLVGKLLASYDQLYFATWVGLCHACCRMNLYLCQEHAHYKNHHVHSLMKQVGRLTNICLVTFMWDIPTVLYRIIKYQ